MAGTAESDVDLRTYAHALRKRKGLILLAALLLAGSALLLSALQDPVYEAEVKILLVPRRTSLFRPDSGVQLEADLAVQTEIEIIKSEPVRAAVAEKLGRVNTVRADRVGETLVIVLRADATAPRRAANLANEYAKSYFEVRNRLLTEVGQDIQREIIENLARVSELNASIASGAPNSAELVRRRDSLLMEQRDLQERVGELDAEASPHAPGAQVLNAAKVPASPVSPKPVRNTILGSVVGLLSGVALASVLEALDGSLSTKDQLRAAGDGLPILGVIPTTTKADGERALVERFSPAADAYRGLATTLQSLSLKRRLRTLQVTSSGRGEGRTTTVANLAVLLAGLGHRVVVADCDFRNPRLHELFGLANETGCTSVLAGKIAARNAVQRIKGDVPLTLLAAGPPGRSSSDLVSPKRVRDMLSDLRREFDLILLDSPPVLPVTDATVLALSVDATILAVRSGVTRRKAFEEAVELLREARAPLVGTVLTDAEEPSHTFDYYFETPAQNGDDAAGRDGSDSRPRPAPQESRAREE